MSNGETLIKLNEIRTYMKDHNLDGMFYTSPENVFYLSGFTGYGDATLLITMKEQLILTDFRYNEQVIVECPDFVQINMGCTDMEETAEIMLGRNLTRVGFENETILYSAFNTLKESAGKIAFVNIDDFTENLRILKSESEIAKIERACVISSVAFAKTFEQTEKGMTEREVAALLEYNMRKEGADGMAFETIVASGLRSAMCHGTATDKKLEDGDPVTVDFGAKFKGYCADMTRTFFIGAPNEKMKEIYKIVYDAQLLALDKIHEGMTGHEADSIARKFISSHSYGEYFGHGLGHGVGIMIHENPRVSRRGGDQILSDGMVFSVEPGIYIPNLGGVRIEDLVCIKNHKLHIMTSFEKNLLCK